MQIDERICPKELVIGITGELCFMTYYETKGKVTSLNSEKSWMKWSKNANDPLIIENKFMRGFKLAGVNERQSRNASNSENMLIMHPAFEKSFEISMKRFMKIAKYSVITNGEFDKEFIVTKSREIISREEYNALVEKADKEEKSKEDKTKDLQTNKISSKDQKVGHIYRDAKNGYEFLYMGTVDIEDNGVTYTRFVYLESPKEPFITEDYTESMYDENKNWVRKVLDSKTVPSIVSVWGGKNSTDKTVRWKLTVAWHLSCLANKKSLSLSKRSDVDFFKDYTDDDWDLIEQIYNKPGVVRYGMMEGWYKITGTPHVNFRNEYLKQKEK